MGSNGKRVQPGAKTRGLRACRAFHSELTASRVDEAIKSLKAKGEMVSLPSISRETKILRPDLPAVAVSTLTRNREANALWLANGDFRLKKDAQERVARAPRKLVRQTKVNLILMTMEALALVEDIKKGNVTLALENLELRADVALLKKRLANVATKASASRVALRLPFSFTLDRSKGFGDHDLQSSDESDHLIDFQDSELFRSLKLRAPTPHQASPNRQA
jgi:hypothetical protein